MHPIFLDLNVPSFLVLKVPNIFFFSNELFFSISSRVKKRSRGAAPRTCFQHLQNRAAIHFLPDGMFFIWLNRLKASPRRLRTTRWLISNNKVAVRLTSSHKVAAQAEAIIGRATGTASGARRTILPLETRALSAASQRMAALRAGTFNFFKKVFEFDSLIFETSDASRTALTDTRRRVPGAATARAISCSRVTAAGKAAPGGKGTGTAAPAQRTTLRAAASASSVTWPRTRGPWVARVTA
jgi:hypothetical protein